MSSLAVAQTPGELIDLHHLGRPGLIGVWRVGGVLIDSGPSSCLPVLLEQLGDWRPDALLLTHIHLDHAGAAGALTKLWPELEVWVHARGAPHLVDPERLMASASRVFGSELDRLFGNVEPVPADNVHELHGRETMYGLEVAATPGHASHHVSFFDHVSRSAYVGDVAGVLLQGGVVVPPTPPPDIDLELWETSLQQVEDWAPAALALSHFGLITDVSTHIALLRQALNAHATSALDGEDSYKAWLSTLLKKTSSEARGGYEIVAPPAQNYAGLARTLRR